MQRTTDGKNYYTFEYALTSPNYASASFATIAIGNGKSICHLKKCQSLNNDLAIYSVLGARRP